MFKRYIGDRKFYRHMAAVAIPIIIQNAITNFVSLLDNIMVGQIGTLEMSGVSIANQLILVFNIAMFGGLSGAGIFTSQFYGDNDHEGIRQSFRFKILSSLVLGLSGVAIFWFAGTPLISLFLQGEGSPQDIQQTLAYGREYLDIMLLGLLPFAVAMVYSGTLRETGQTTVPMIAGIVAVCVNLVLNFVLIFGHLGLPAMGARGAALATVLSRYVELAIVMIWTHRNGEAHPFIKGAYRSMYVPKWLLVEIFKKGMPLLINEFLFSSSLAMLNQCYSLRGLDVVAAMNINSTLRNLTSVVFLSMGRVTAIIIGQMMGASRPAAEVRDTNRKITAFTIACCVVFAGITIALSGLFPQIYNTTPQVRSLAAKLICVVALAMPFHGYIQVTYFAIRAGGKSWITFMFDAGFMWVVSVPLAFILSRFTHVPIVPLYGLCLSTEGLKCVMGWLLLRSDNWIQNLTNNKSAS